MNFAFVYIYHHIYRKWVSLVDSICWNTVILTGLTYTSSRKVFHDGCAKRGIFSQQILNKNSLSLCLGAALILAKMPHDKVTAGMQQLCNVQITPLRKVRI